MEGRQPDDDALAEVASAYLESWLDGDGERMRSALHPMLAKRGLDYGPEAAPTGLHHLDAEDMVDIAGREPRPGYRREFEVTILDVADNVASVKVISEPFVDYVHLAKIDGTWSIVNVLYEDRDPLRRSQVASSVERPRRGGC